MGSDHKKLTESKVSNDLILTKDPNPGYRKNYTSRNFEPKRQSFGHFPQSQGGGCDEAQKKLANRDFTKVTMLYSEAFPRGGPKKVKKCDFSNVVIL